MSKYQNNTIIICDAVCVNKDLMNNIEPTIDKNLVLELVLVAEL